MGNLLQPAHVSQSALKLGLFGKPGAGKTLSGILVLIGMAKRDGLPKIAMMDTEGGSDFVADVCQTEGIELLVVKARSFVEMRDALREAQDAGCSGFLVDSYSEPWAELNEAIREKFNLRGRKLQFQHRDELYLVWRQWVREMLESPLHCVLAGRLSHEYDDTVDEAGDTGFIKVGTKMRGEADAGYEPHLLIEVDAIRDSLARDKKTRSKQGRMVHSLTVLKDRFRALNGRSFPLKDINRYAEGDYKKTFAIIQEHVDHLQPRSEYLSPVGREVLPARQLRTSAELFTPVSGESVFSERARRVTIAVEEVQAALNAIWPGQTAEDKRFRAIITQTIFDSRSWAAIESMLPEKVEAGWRIMQHFESAVDASNKPECEPALRVNVRDEAQVVDLIQSCKDLEKERQENVGVL